jgi:hypothetical protein
LQYPICCEDVKHIWSANKVCAFVLKPVRSVTARHLRGGLESVGVQLVADESVPRAALYQRARSQRNIEVRR